MIKQSHGRGRVVSETGYSGACHEIKGMASIVVSMLPVSDKRTLSHWYVIEVNVARFWGIDEARELPH